MYKQAPKQAYFELCSLWDGAFSRILYFGLQTGTKTKLVLVVYVYGVVLLLASCTSIVYGMVLLVASCTSVYKQAPKQN